MFYQEIEKNNLQKLLFIHRLTILLENLQKGNLLIVQKTWPERILEFFIFALFVAQKSAKMAIFAIFRIFMRYK